MDLKHKRNSHHGGSNDNVEIAADSATKHSCVELGARTCSSSAIHLHTSTPISRLQSRPKGARCIWMPAVSMSQATPQFCLGETWLLVASKYNNTALVFSLLFYLLNGLIDQIEGFLILVTSSARQTTFGCRFCCGSLPSGSQQQLQDGCSSSVGSIKPFWSPQSSALLECVGDWPEGLTFLGLWLSFKFSVLFRL